MVRQPLRDIDTKKIKMAQNVLAFLEILGVRECDLDNLVEKFPEKIQLLEQKIIEFEEFKEEIRERLTKVEKTLRTENTNTSKGIKTPSEAMRELYNGGVEEFNPHGRK